MQMSAGQIRLADNQYKKNKEIEMHAKKKKKKWCE